MDRAAMLREILAGDAGNVFARYGLALELVNGGDMAAGLAEFDTLLAANPDYVPAWQMAGQTLLDHGEPERARTYLEKGLTAAKAIGNEHAAREIAGLLDQAG